MNRTERDELHAALIASLRHEGPGSARDLAGRKRFTDPPSVSARSIGAALASLERKRIIARDFHGARPIYRLADGSP